MIYNVLGLKGEFRNCAFDKYEGLPAPTGDCTENFADDFVFNLYLETIFT